MMQIYFGRVVFGGERGCLLGIGLVMGVLGASGRMVTFRQPRFLNLLRMV